jgi:drug/metabolite transporter (DMT)-like permease
LVFLGRVDEFASAIFALMIPALFFFAWNPRLLRGSPAVPRRSYALFAVGAVLSLGYFYSLWNEGLKVQGVSYTYSLFSANIAAIAVLGFVFARKEPSFRYNLFLHWTLFLWMSWFAFPFLGKLSFP